MILENLPPLSLFTQVDNILPMTLFASACLAGITGAVKITRPEAVLAPPTSILLVGKQ